MAAPDADDAPPSPVVRAVLAVTCALLAVILAWALISQPGARRNVGSVVVEALERSGVENPVTAVLLNFRAFDTMLELVVLLVVAAAVMALSPIPPSAVKQRAAGRRGTVLDSLVHDLIPVMILVGGYLLWIGAYAPGGAFQAGAVLAAAAVMAHFSPRFRYRPRSAGRMRLWLVLGPAAFLAAALAALAVTGVYFGYPREDAGTWILAVETLATISIAALLYCTFCAVVPDFAAGTLGE